MLQAVEILKYTTLILALCLMVTIIFNKLEHGKASAGILSKRIIIFSWVSLISLYLVLSMYKTYLYEKQFDNGEELFINNRVISLSKGWSRKGNVLFRGDEYREISYFK